MTEVQRARKKPVEIEFMRWDGTAEAATPVIDWILANGGTARYHEGGETLADPNCPNAPYHETHRYCPTCAWHSEPEHLRIDTLEGSMRADVGDVIIRGVQGEFYPCKPGIFAETYDVLEVPTIEDVT